MTDVVILDYGSGNLRSAQRALERVGAQVVVTDDLDAARAATGLVVPGVGAFGACMRGLREVGGDALIRERLDSQRPVLGICVGMQVLFRAGYEHSEDNGGHADGVGIFDTDVRELKARPLPHMGWNTVGPPAGSALFAGIGSERFYFVHSFAATAAQGAITWAEHGERFVAAVEHGALSATQFHPEKSGDAGAELLRNWLSTLD